MFKKLLFVFLFLCQIAVAQDTKIVSGVVHDGQGYELPGATIIIKGTLRGTTTNLDGEYKIEGVNSTDTLVFSYLGLQSQEIIIGNQTTINVVLKDDVNDLNEVVVIGYGTSKSKDLTSPIVTIHSDEITSMNTSSAMDAIQGKVAGVTVITNGAPGAGPSVRIRGIGSIQNSNPLYVVDGMFLNDINFLSPNDIESMSILKDASAAAIYGVRAANGVVLITTKSGGRNQKMHLTYDGYYGVQSVTQRLKMSNSEQYANFMKASGDPDLYGYVEAAISRYGGSNGIPSVSTDWYDELIRSSAPIQNHSLGLTGGNEKSSYAFSLGYFGQDGIMNATGDYKRINFRTKIDYDVTEKIKLGFNLLMSNINRLTDDNDAWFQAFINTPMYPVYDYSQSDEESYPIKFANPHNLGYNTYYTNPVSKAYYRGDNKSKVTRLMPSIYIEISPFNKADVVFRSAMNMEYKYGADRYYIPEYKVGNSIQEINSLSKRTNWNYNYVWDNTATWNNNWDSHSLKSMVGFSMREENYRWLKGTAQGVQNKDYINSGDASTTRAYDGGTRFRGMSAFARFSYDYDHKYLLAVTMRADGSSKYQEKWGFFPSVGTGWVLSEEGFFKGLKSSKVDYFKLRASWGMLGNDRVPANDGFASVTTGGLDQSGIFGGTNLIPGMINNTAFSILEWEVVYETNVGIDAKFLDYRLNFEADYYSRDTKNMVINTTLPMGNGYLLQNAGSVRNSGIELIINWSDEFESGFNYSIGANLTTIKNKVLDIAGQPYLQTGSQEFPQRSIVGHPLFSFYGWEVEGVYQNQTEIDADPIAVANGLKPGDLKFADLNDDGVLDDSDRTLLGDPNPDFTYGLNISLGYKGFNLAASFQGVSGATIFNRKRADINKHPANNMDANLADNVWTGEGSTNSYPSAEGMFNTWNNGRLSDFYLEDGSYFRIQNIRLSYDLPESFLNKIGIRSTQFFVNTDRPYTFFSSNGFTPEVPGGIDQTVYPLPSVFSFGAHITF